MKKNIKRIRSLRRYLVFLSALVSMVSIFIIILFFSNEVDDYLIEQKQNYAEESLSRSSFILERELNKVTNLVGKIQNNETIISSVNALENSDDSPIVKYKLSQQLNDFLFSLNQESFLIKNILIITPKTQYSATGDTAGYELNGLEITDNTNTYSLYSVPTLLQDANSNKYTMQEILNRSNTYLKDEYFFAANIADSNKQQKALVLVVIDEREFANQLLARDQSQIIFNESAVFFQGERFDKKKMGDRYLADIYPYNLQLVYQMDETASDNTPVIIGILIASALSVLMLSFFLSKSTSDTTLEPINELLDWMNRRQATEKKFPLNAQNRFGSRSFRERLTYYFFVTIIIPVVVVSGLYSWHAYQGASREMTALHASEQSGKALILSQEVKQFKKILATFSSTFGLTNRGSLDLIDEASLDEFKTAYLDTFSNESIGVYNAEGDLVVSSGAFVFNTVEKSLLMNRENNQSRFSYNVGMTNRGESFLSLVLPIAYQSNFDQPLGFVVLNISEKYFGSIPLITGDNTEFLTDNDLFVWNLNQQTIQLLNDDTRESLLDMTGPSSKISFGDWQYGSQLNQQSLREDIQNIFIRNSYLYFILILILLAITNLLTRRVIKPFNALLINFQQDPENWEQAQLAEKVIGIDEVEKLRQNFTRGLERLNALVDEKQELQEHYLNERYKKREIQLFALQDQVNPHFLYNALENLLYLVEAEETDRALAMVSSLSRFFQFVTNRKELMIPVSKEIAFTKNYLEIMQERFNNFSVSWDIEDTVVDEKVMKLILQPLVENVIHHNVSLTDSLVQITISIKKQDGMICFTVMDDGIGIEESKLQEIKAELLASSYNKSGLYNVHDRINLYYGSQSNFSIDSKVHEGTTVTICIPAKNKQP
ncbi:sensor histidine kinase [Jeotgalibaca sp. A122]|uniref:sensor histidine kinase n=1 Tax=Jeotgalibaca sp. A122 TaxID=3457322 RepID=UPI003FD2A6EC